jgi:hypothetical protein
MALALMLGRQMPGEAAPRVVFAAAATGDFRCLIRPERLAKGRGDLDVYKDIFLKDIVTGTGRVRGGMESHQADAAAYRDLADDVRKVVLDAIEAPGLNPVALAGDEIVLLVPEQAMNAAGAIEAATEEIRSPVEGAAREFLDSIPIVCEVRKAAAW